jgi:hypothetical protein
MDETKPKRPGPTPSQDAIRNPGWIACTTDSILAMKDTLWDVLITMPPPHSSAAKEHVWPTVECPGGIMIKATQRDLRRYKALRNGLFWMQSHSNVAAESPDTASPTTPRVLTSPQKQTQDDPLLDEAEKIVEPLSWAALAYNGFMWWASAGEQARSDEAEEASNDASLLADVTYAPGMSRTGEISSSITSLQARRSSSVGGPTAPPPTDEARAELAIITYFHRLTTQILTKIVDLVESSSNLDDHEDEEDDALLGSEGDERAYEDHGVKLTREDIRTIGLDRWSEGDAEFVKQVVDIYFDRTAYIEGKAIEVCGVRVC